MHGHTGCHSDRPTPHHCCHTATSAAAALSPRCNLVIIHTVVTAHSSTSPLLSPHHVASHYDRAHCAGAFCPFVARARSELVHSASYRSVSLFLLIPCWPASTVLLARCSSVTFVFFHYLSSFPLLRKQRTGRLFRSRQCAAHCVLLLAFIRCQHWRRLFRFIHTCQQR